MKRVLIIGASSGIGAAVAELFSLKHGGTEARFGLELILHGRDQARLESVVRRCRESGMNGKETGPGRPDSLGGARCEILTGDVADWVADPKSIPAIEPVDAVVWSAGICELAAGQMLSLKAVRRTLSVNLEAPLVVLSHFYRKGVIKDGGVIVLLGSESAHDAGEGFSVYAASKGGLAAAARVLAKEFARRGVRVCCLEPGTVDTPMTRKLVETFGALKDGHAERMVSAADVAAQVAELVGP
jgi:NAD(P)-dependent dehydrogenase (short-subunit alcohol dehydrogenase family)